jgi:hypothetical protein
LQNKISKEKSKKEKIKKDDGRLEKNEKKNEGKN